MGADGRQGKNSEATAIEKKVVAKLKEASFQDSGPKLFNNLSKNIRALQNISVDELKETLDKVLSEVPQGTKR